MKSWFGTFHESRSAEPIEVTVLVSDKKLTIGFRGQENEVITRTWLLSELEAVFDFSQQATSISPRHEKGQQLLVAGKDAAVFIQEVKNEKARPWHQQRKTREIFRYLALFFITIAIFVGLYLLAVPWLSEKMADKVSVETEEQLGEAIYSGLKPSLSVDTQASRLTNDFFRELRISSAYSIRISVVNSSELNAFALPGGRIVVYSALLQKIKTYPELAALLSHEFTHVNDRHSTRSIFRRLGSRVFLGLLLGKIGSVTAVMVDQADNLKSLTYSRKLEKEADLNGLDLLKERKIDPEGFAILFTQLKQGASASGMPEFLESHPDIDNRIAYIREAAKGSVVEENLALKNIFDNIKQSKP